MAKRKKHTSISARPEPDYGVLVSGISDLLDQARRMSSRAVNSILTATYWEIGRRIVEYEQGGKARAEYGEALLKRLGNDLTARHGRGFSAKDFRRCGCFTSIGRFAHTVGQVRGSGSLIARAGELPIADLPDTVGHLCPPGGVGSLLAYSRAERVLPTPSTISEREKVQTASAESALIPDVRQNVGEAGFVPTDLFPLSWSQYVRLMAVADVVERNSFRSSSTRSDSHPVHP